MLAYSVFVGALSTAIFWIAVVVGVACILDWLVRTRRVGPFSPIARFSQRVIDPFVRPMERVIVRAGGQPSSAPLWTLAAVVLGGLILIQVLNALGGLIFQLSYAVANPAQLPWLLIYWTLSLISIALLVRVLSSWFGGSPYSPWIRWSYLLTDWLIEPLRRIIPQIGMIDITPLVAWFLIRIIQGLLPV